MSTEANLTTTPGGGFLLQETLPANIFIPEEFTEESLQVAGLFDEFIDTKIHPVLDKLDKMDPPGLLEQLMTEAGQAGMLGLSIPEEYNGFGQDFLTSMLTTEKLGKGYSFSVAVAAHTGIGTLPILYFGNDEQKQKYLPKLATGESKSSYCLTEPDSGSDALGAKTKAVLTEDGSHYVINGQKMWITNAGFADVFIVFAKIDGEHFTAFIVEKGAKGLELGEEEDKMGIKGSSTRQVFFNDVKVPKENLLGEIGKGHLIAFNILNIGRIKLAAATLGGAKQAASLSIAYANERKQFGKPISSFGAIQHKLAEQAVKTYALESATYRASNDIQRKRYELAEAGKSMNEALLGAAKEYAAECAILKVLGSETLDYVVDEGVQVFGGYGFSAEYPMDRPYRDSRINRIFEGTNEINRMLTVDYVLKKAMKGELPFFKAAQAVQAELMAIPDFGGNGEEEWLGAERSLLENMKKAVLLAAGAAAQKFMQKLDEQQEILMHIADMAIWLYAAESTYLRARKIAALKGKEAAEIPGLIVQAYLYEVVEPFHTAGKRIAAAAASGDEQRMMLLGLKRFTKAAPFNIIDARRKIAAHLIDANAYNL